MHTVETKLTERIYTLDIDNEDMNCLLYTSDAADEP